MKKQLKTLKNAARIEHKEIRRIVRELMSSKSMEDIRMSDLELKLHAKRIVEIEKEIADLERRMRGEKI